MQSVSVEIAEPNWFVEQWRKRPQRVLLSLILLLGFALRIVRLGTWPYWQDEVHNLIKADHFAEALRGAYVSNHPPLFAGLVALWRALGWGDTEWTMRLLPLFLGLGAIVAVYLFTRRLFGVREGLFAAFLLAISPFHLLHSQDLKVYILLPFTGTLMVYALYRATEENRVRLWVVYALLAAVACYSEFFAGPLLVAMGFWFLYAARGRWNRFPGWAGANVVGALLFLPYLGVLFEKAGNIMVKADTWWVRKPNLWSVIFYLKTIAFGYCAEEPYFKIALVVFMLAASAGAVLAWRSNRLGSLLLAMWLVIPVGLVFAVSISGKVNSIFLIRAMLPYAIPVYVFVGVMAGRLPSRVLRGIAAMVFVCVAALPIWQRWNGEYCLELWPHRPGIHHPKEYKQAAHLILDNWREGDIVIHASPCTWAPFYWYGFQEKRHQYTGVQGSHVIDAISGTNPRNNSDPDFDTYFPHEVQTLVPGAARVWYVYSEWERAWLEWNALPTWRWFSTHYAETARYSFRGIDVCLFESERGGRPLTVTERNEDDGVSARLTYEGIPEPYHQVFPDAGLIPRSVDARRGALTLRFADAAGGDRMRLTEGERTRTVSFSIENQSDAEAVCDVDVVPSDVLLQAASMLESAPESDVWKTGRNEYDGLPRKYECAVVVGTFSEPTDAALLGELTLAPGYYETFLFLSGAPSEVKSRHAEIRVLVDGVDIARQLPRNRSDLAGWRWFRGGHFQAPYGGGRVPVRIEGAPLEAVSPSHIAVGYVAFRGVDHGLAPAPGPVYEPWPGKVTIPARETRTWATDVHADIGRVDIWAFEEGEDGRAYRILRVFNPEGN